MMMLGTNYFNYATLFSVTEALLNVNVVSLLKLLRERFFTSVHELKSSTSNFGSYLPIFSNI